MPDFYVKPGDSVSFAKTVGESDIYLFAGITGDFAVNHVNEQYMARSKYGRRIAHGVLMLGFASTCSTMMIDKCNGIAGDETAVSLGYDKVRFLGAVYIGDTLTLPITIPLQERRKAAERVEDEGGSAAGKVAQVPSPARDPVDEVSDFEVSPFKMKHDPRAGAKKLAAPGGQSFWIAQSTGTNPSLDWKAGSDEYRMVVMNADGSRGVRTHGDASITIPHTAAIAWSLVGGGLLLLLMGAATIATARASQHAPRRVAGHPTPA